MKKETKEYLESNTYASIRIFDIPVKMRYVLISLVGDKVFDMVKKEDILEALKIEVEK